LFRRSAFEEDENTQQLQTKLSTHFGIFDTIADEYNLVASKMTRRLVTIILDNFKYSIANKYQASGKSRQSDQELTFNPEMADIATLVSTQLHVVYKHIQYSRFTMVWRTLATDLDTFLSKHFNFSDTQPTEQLATDITGLITSIFGKFTSKPLNFCKKSKAFVSKI
jgi:predicted component of type VI protein secretion system